MSEKERLPEPDWIALWESAAGATAGRDPFEDVYTGPVWAGPAVEAPARAQVWKVSVLERRPGGGAEHWGHLFLVQGEGHRVVTLEPQSPVPGVLAPRAIETLPGPGDLPFEVRIRPVAENTSDRLRAFGERFLTAAEELFRSRTRPSGPA